MFSVEDREKLIKELNTQLENNEFYNLESLSKPYSDIIDIAKPTKNPIKPYSNLATIQGFDMDDVTENKKIIKSAYVTPQFSSVGLFKPLVYESSYNPLKKTVFNYQATYETAIHGLAFGDSKSGFVEKPLSKTYDIVENKSDPGIPIRQIAANTYCIADIIKETKESNVLQFATIPKEHALIKKEEHPFRDFWMQPIDIVGTIKRVLKI